MHVNSREGMITVICLFFVLQFVLMGADAAGAKTARALTNIGNVMNLISNY